MPYAEDFSVEDLDLSYLDEYLERAKEFLDKEPFEFYSNGMNPIIEIVARDGYEEGISLAALVASSYPGKFSRDNFDAIDYGVVLLGEKMTEQGWRVDARYLEHGWNLCNFAYFKGAYFGLDSYEMDTEEKEEKIQEFKQELRKAFSYNPLN